MKGGIRFLAHQDKAGLEQLLEEVQMAYDLSSIVIKNAIHSLDTKLSARREDRSFLHLSLCILNLDPIFLQYHAFLK